MTGDVRSLFPDPPFRIAIVGDVMTDRYLQGRVTRISPEAPVPVVLHQHRADRPGGAANVALNIRALGAVPFLFSVIGDDEEGGILNDLLTELGLSTGGLVTETDRRTTLKTRILAGGQQLLRVDTEDTHAVAPQTTVALLERFEALLHSQKPHALLLQDYNKGLLEEGLIRDLIAMARSAGVPVTVDPKFRNFLAYRGVTLFKPNLKELCEGLGQDIPPEEQALARACRVLHGHLEHNLSLITLSDRGAFWYDHVRDAWGHCLPQPRDIVDVCGAGDTVIATATLALCAGWNTEAIARLANLAGGLACERVGVTPLERTRLEADLADF